MGSTPPHQRSQVVVSLSTIPPRFPFIGETLQSLLNQSIKPDKIELWIPKSYRRFPDHVFCLPDVPDGVTIETTDDDLGPATKVLPSVQKYRGTDTQIVYVDDDQNYWKDFLKSCLEAAVTRPDECIAAIGHDVGFYLLDDAGGGRIHKRVDNSFISKVSGTRSHLPRVNHRRGGLRNLPSNLPYWIAREIAFRNQKGSAWMIWKPDCGYADIAAGFGGVLIKPDFFDDSDFDIPPILWTVDDIWLSGCLARKGIPIWVERLVAIHGSEKNTTGSGSLAALVHSVIDGFDRRQANQKCIQYFQEIHGVWL